ncbi:VWA domain-containing protein [Pendulispora albinea]|uniref:VWA domain-containing protein n=1 Tax=Pendulispora albinea TaxID=2741071 RepID=A0ABZ2M8E3_9BACT
MGGLELLNAPGLWLLTALGPLILFYVLKVRRQRVRIASTWLWAAAQRDLMAKQPFRKLVAELPLLLQILALVALAVALARPAARGGKIAGDHVAIVVDTSASMGARMDAGGAPTTRMAAAQKAVRDVIANMEPGADAIVIEAAREAKIVSPPERDRRRLEEAVASLEVRELEGELAPAVALAADRLRSMGGRKRMVIVTDGALAKSAPLAAADVDVQLVAVDEAAQGSGASDNAAIVRIDVRSGIDTTSRGGAAPDARPGGASPDARPGGASPDGRLGDGSHAARDGQRREQAQVFVMIRNYADRARDTFVTLRIEDRAEPIASRRVLLPAKEKTPVVLTFEPASSLGASDRGKGLIVQLSDPEGREASDRLPLDDVAYGRVPSGYKMPVTLASAAPYSWVARALEADPSIDLQRLTLAQLDTVNVDPEALVIVEGGCPENPPGRDLVVIAPPAGRCRETDVLAPVANPQLTSWEAGDARLRFLTLDGVHVSRATPLRAIGAEGSLVRAGTATLMADASIPGRAVTLVGFDVGDSDWPLQASFVLFVRNLVEQSRLHRIQGAAGPVRTGDPLRIAVPNGITTVRVEGPGMADHELSASGGFVVVPGVDRAGIYHVRWSSPRVGAATVAANLTSEAESDVLARKVLVDTSSGAGATTVRSTPGHREWNTWLLTFAALVLAFDLWWLTRGRQGQLRAGSYALLALSAAPLLYVALTHGGILRETYVRFGAPAALWLLLAAGAFVAWRIARLPMRMSSARRSLVTWLVAASILGALFAVAEPELGRPLDRTTLILALDRSRSIDLVSGADKRMAAETSLAERGMHDDDRIGVVAFGADAQTEDPPRPKSDLPPPQRANVGRDGTDLAGAIRRSLAELPADTQGRIALMTDGVQTRGDALAAAALAVAARVPIDVVPLDQRSIPDVRVVSVRAPVRADEGEPLDLRVVTSSPAATDVEIRVKRDGEPIHTGRAHIGAGEDVLRLRETAAGPGLHRYDVEISAVDPNADGAPEDNSGSTFVRVRGPSLALVLEGDSGKGAPLAQALSATGFRVVQRTTSGVPADVGELAGFDLVVLSDVRASDLAPSQIDALASYAKDLGGGLLLMGGDRSMGPGGYARTAIEDVSPVSFDLKEEKRRASLAEVIAIDYSGSMGMTVGGKTKLALANEAAARSASLLGPGDRLGVEHVDDRIAWTIPVSPVTDVEGIAKKIQAVSVGGGGIYTDIALKAGYEALQSEQVNLKHLLLFADGDDAERLAGCRALTKTAMDHGITTSVISLGRGNDTAELEVLSKIGGGRFYLIDDASKLPAVFSQETILASKGAIKETPFHAGIGAPIPATRGIDFSHAPPLGGYVITVKKPRATVALTAEEGDPLLATWAVGIGRVAAFTSDFKDRWGREWLQFPGALKMFGQLARDTARKSDDPRVRLESDTSGGELHIRADVIGDDGRAQTFRRLTVHVAGPDGFARDLALEAVGAGRYAASVPLSRPGTYVATAKDELGGEAVGTTGAALTAGEELRPTGTDRALLTRIATMTGGKVRDTLAGIYDDRGARRFAYTPLGAPLALLAALAMVLGVGARRLGVPDFVTHAAARLRGLSARSKEAREKRAETRAAAIQRAQEIERLNTALLATKQRATPLSRTPHPAPPTAGPGLRSPQAPPPAAAPAPPASPADPAAPPARELSAAEKLALKRRERR